MPKIVIIEDDATFAGIYRDKFAEAGFEAVLASDGMAGLELVKSAKPDLVVLDLMLPNISGFELLSEIRALPDANKTAIIIVTNLDQHAEEERARALGADAYFVKAHATFAEVLGKAKELIKT